MAFVTKKSASPKQPEPDINVTPLVDVMLVLLIIFMVVTPALSQGDTIILPEILNADKKPKDVDPIDLSLTLEGDVKVGEEVIAKADLKPKLVAMHAEQPNRKLMIKADSRIPYSRIRETFAVLQGIGFRGVALQTIQKEDS